MKEINKKGKIKKVIWVTLLSIAGGLLLVSVCFYFILHSYINKMNLTNAKAENPTVLAENAMEEEAENELFELEPNGEDVYSMVDSVPSITEVLGTSFVGEKVVPPDGQDEIDTLDAKIQQNIENSKIEVMKDKKVRNILLIGSDTRNTKERGRSDSMILVSLNKETKTITATSFLRDIYLQIPGKKNNRLNASYAYGGATLLMDTIKQNFKIQIDQYILVDFYSFIDIVDVIGGITLEVKAKELDTINSYIRSMNDSYGIKKDMDIIDKEGTYLLNGKQVLGYCRNRYTTNGDFDRTQRQRQVLRAVFDKVKDLNLLELNDLFNVILPQVTTNFTEGEIFEQILAMPSYLGYHLEQWSIPMKGSYQNIKIRGMAVLGIDFEENIAEIHRRLYNKEY